MRTTIINNYNLKYQFSPNSARKPPSTPEKPMNANDTRHAVSSSKGMPRIPFGMFTIPNRSRTTHCQSNIAFMIERLL